MVKVIFDENNMFAIDQNLRYQQNLQQAGVAVSKGLLLELPLIILRRTFSITYIPFHKSKQHCLHIISIH